MFLEYHSKASGTPRAALSDTTISACLVTWIVATVVCFAFSRDMAEGVFLSFLALFLGVEASWMAVLFARHWLHRQWIGLPFVLGPFLLVHIAVIAMALGSAVNAYVPAQVVAFVSIGSSATAEVFWLWKIAKVTLAQAAILIVGSILLAAGTGALCCYMFVIVFIAR